MKNLDVTVKVKLESQSMPNYPTNKADFVSNFMAPFDANFSLGINYKPTLKKIRVEIFCAPLSAYNYRFVRYGKLTSRYGIRAGRHHKEDFGTQLMITVPKQTLHSATEAVNSHNDHRIVMAMSVILSKIGGEISGIEAVRKSYPGFFDDIQKLGAKVDVG